MFSFMYNNLELRIINLFSLPYNEPSISTEGVGPLHRVATVLHLLGLYYHTHTRKMCQYVVIG